MTEEEMRKGYKFSGEPTVKFDPTSLSGGDAMRLCVSRDFMEAVSMTVTTEEAEWLAKQHDLVRFTLGMKAPEHDLTAASIRSLAAERDALQARVAELDGALQKLLAMNDDHGPFGGEIYQDRIDRAWDKARAALEGKKP